VRGTQARSKLPSGSLRERGRGAHQPRENLARELWSHTITHVGDIKDVAIVQKRGAENKSALVVYSVEGVSAFPFLNRRGFQPPQSRTRHRQNTQLAYIDRKIGSRLGLLLLLLLLLFKFYVHMQASFGL
jgi:hypothetical protein